MNLPWRGLISFLLIFIAAQDPAPDLVAQYSEVLATGPEARRDLAARALLSLGRPGHDALRRALAASPALAKSVTLPAEPPALALVRSPADARDEAESWKALDSPDSAVRARATLRELYTPPADPVPPRPSPALKAHLDRKRDFHVADRLLTDLLRDEPVSWILLGQRVDRVTLTLRDVSFRDFLRAAAPQLAAVPVGELLVLVPADRVASVEPPPAVWAPADQVRPLEAALDALDRDDDGPIGALTGVAVYHALKRGGEKRAKRADDLRAQLRQRIFFIGERGDDEGPKVTSESKGEAKTGEMLAAFEKQAGRAVAVRSKDALDQRAPEFRFRDIPAALAARALEFRLNYIR
jgi:hypothetical protein